jgi:hypothetical protein
MSNSVSGVDSSFSTWAEATIGAAEAYAQEQAEAAAAERDLAEQRAAAFVTSGKDVVERPPSATERAQAAFWGSDPNRATSAAPSGTTSPPVDSSVGQPVTREQAAALIAANEKVTHDGRGNYTWYPPPGDLRITEQAPLEAPSNIVPIPSYSGNTTTVPTESRAGNPADGVPQDGGPRNEPPQEPGLEPSFVQFDDLLFGAGILKDLILKGGKLLIEKFGEKAVKEGFERIGKKGGTELGEKGAKEGAEALGSRPPKNTPANPNGPHPHSRRLPPRPHPPRQVPDPRSLEAPSRPRTSCLPAIHLRRRRSPLAMSPSPFLAGAA